MKARIFAAVAGCLCCALFSPTGFSEVVTQSTMSIFSRTVPWSALPDGVQSTLQHHSGATSIAGVQQTMRDGQVVYRALFQENGQPTELVVMPDWSLFGNRSRLTWNDVSPAAQQAYLSLYDLSAL